MTTVKIYTLLDLAKAAGLGYGSIRTLHARSVRRRRLSTPLQWDLPKPDIYIGRSPTWQPQTVQAWLEHRRAYKANRRGAVDGHQQRRVINNRCGRQGKRGPCMAEVRYAGAACWRH